MKKNSLIIAAALEVTMVTIAAAMFIINLLFPGALTIRTAEHSSTEAVEQPIQRVVSADTVIVIKC